MDRKPKLLINHEGGAYGIRYHYGCLPWENTISLCGADFERVHQLRAANGDELEFIRDQQDHLMGVKDPSAPNGEYIFDIYKANVATRPEANVTTAQEPQNDGDSRPRSPQQMRQAVRALTHRGLLEPPYNWSAGMLQPSAEEREEQRRAVQALTGRKAWEK